MYFSAFVELVSSTKLTRVSNLLSKEPTYKQYTQDEKTDYSEVLAQLNQKESAAPFTSIILPLLWAFLAMVIAFSTSLLGCMLSVLALIGIVYMLCTRNDDLEKSATDLPSRPSCT